LLKVNQFNLISYKTRHRYSRNVLYIRIPEFLESLCSSLHGSSRERVRMYKISVAQINNINFDARKDFDDAYYFSYALYILPFAQTCLLKIVLFENILDIYLSKVKIMAFIMEFTINFRKFKNIHFIRYIKNSVKRHEKYLIFK
jgi:hypothetical protein